MKYKSANKGEKVVKSDYSKKIIFPVSDLPPAGHLLQTVTIPPQTKQRKHFHHAQTEIFYIIDGEAIISINNTDYNAKKGDAFVCSPKDIHSLWNQSDKEFTLVVFKINMAEVGDDTEWLE